MAERNIPGNETPAEQQENLVSGKDRERKEFKKEDTNREGRGSMDKQE